MSIEMQTTKKFSDESRFVTLIEAVCSNSIESQNVKLEQGEGAAIVVTMTLQLLEDISAPSVFLDCVNTIYGKLDEITAEDLGEISLKEVVEIKAACPKFFMLLTNSIEVMVEDELDGMIDMFSTQILIAIVLWTMIKFNKEKIGSFIFEAEHHIQFIENEDGAVEVIFVNNKDLDESEEE